MSAVDAHNALGRRLQSLPDRPAISYPNGPSVADLPRIVLQNAGASQSTATLAGETRAVVEIVARVDVKRHDFTAEADAIVKAIVDHFPVGDTFDGVVVTRAPEPRPGYVTADAYSVPVVIRGLAQF